MLLGAYIPFIHPDMILGLSVIFLGGLILSHYYENKRTKSNGLFSILLIINGLLIGSYLSYRIDVRHNQSHYSHYLQGKNPVELELVITKSLKSNISYRRYISRVRTLNGYPVTGKILLKIPVKIDKMIPGTTLRLLLSTPQIQSPPSALNPYTFDYRAYLTLQNVYHQIVLKNIAWRIEKRHQNQVIDFLYSQREKIKNAFDKIPSKKSRALATALLLGERQDLSPETYQNFQAAGTIHILAISGLHIGILLVFLNFIFYPIKRKNTGLFLFLTIGLLWFYALLTGLPASVVRAVVMFSFLQTGLQIKRKTNIYNTLFAAALVLLLIYPPFLYQVGFQMSFTAVLSIVSFQPVFSRWFSVNNKILQRWLDLFWVSVSAQLGVFPLTLYYFHQFPTYFFIANLLVIPLLFIILFIGFLSMIAIALSVHIPVLFSILDFFLQILLNINRQIASWRYSLIQHIYFPDLLLIISLLLIVLLYLFLKDYRNFKRLALFLTGIFLLQAGVIFIKYRQTKTDAFYVFHQFKTPVVARLKQGNLTIYQDKNVINPYLLQALQTRFSHIVYDSLPVFQEFNHHKILHIDSLGIYRFKDYRPDIVIIHYSPKFNADKMINHLQPAIIVADGSNYPSYSGRWKGSAEHYGIRFIDTRNGAFVLKNDE
jgi:competence protein ComEC